MSSRKRTKRIKRSHLRRFSAKMVGRGTGPTPNQQLLAEHTYRARPVDNMTARLFGIGEGLSGAHNEGRVEALVKRSRLLKGLERIIAGVPIHRHICFINTKIRKLFMFYTREYCVFIEFYVVAQQFRRSLHYADAAEAKSAYLGNRITWVQMKDFVPPSLTSSEQSTPRSE